MTLATEGSAGLGQRLRPLLEPLFGFALARSSRRELALDAVQEALRAALLAEKQGRHWPDEEALWAWLVAVTRNKIADEWRAARRTGFSPPGGAIPVQELSGILLDGAALPVEQAGRQEVARICRAALSELPPRQAEALDSFYRAGRSHDQIAQQLAVSPKAVESLLARARVSLQTVLRRIVSRPEDLL